MSKTIENILKLRTKSGVVHYYQVYKGETIRDLKKYLESRYKYKNPKFEFKGDNISDDALLSDLIGKEDSFICIIPDKKMSLSRKIQTEPKRHEFNLKPDPLEINLPPKPELIDINQLGIQK